MRRLPLAFTPIYQALCLTIATSEFAATSLSLTQAVRRIYELPEPEPLSAPLEL
jgi:hypothetical protein